MTLLFVILQKSLPKYLHTFFIDFEGWYEDSNIQKLLNILEEISDELRIIGSYPVKS